MNNTSAPLIEAKAISMANRNLDAVNAFIARSARLERFVADARRAAALYGSAPESSQGALFADFLRSVRCVSQISAEIDAIVAPAGMPG